MPFMRPLYDSSVKEKQEKIFLIVAKNESNSSILLLDFFVGISEI